MEKETVIIEATDVRECSWIFREVFDFQNTNQEKIIHQNWEAASVRFDLEGAGDIFRELTKGKFSDAGYIGEKTRRVDCLLKKLESGMIHPADTIQRALERDTNKVNRLIELWEQQPVANNEQEIARRLNLALLRNDIAGARNLLAQIQNLFWADWIGSGIQSLTTRQGRRLGHGDRRGKENYEVF